MQIRAEQEKDFDAVFELNTAAFDGPAEAALVNTLRAAAAPIISLVAENNSQIVGHILFSPVTLEEQGSHNIVGLAPMAVAPERQRSGIGARLVEAGLQQCREIGVCAVVVLGHPQYYPRFGFSNASTFGITSEYDVPDEVFMALELVPDALRELSGTIEYHPTFKNV